MLIQKELQPGCCVIRYRRNLMKFIRCVKHANMSKHGSFQHPWLQTPNCQVPSYHSICPQGRVHLTWSNVNKLRWYPQQQAHYIKTKLVALKDPCKSRGNCLRPGIFQSYKGMTSAYPSCLQLPNALKLRIKPLMTSRLMTGYAHPPRSPVVSTCRHQYKRSMVSCDILWCISQKVLYYL